MELTYVPSVRRYSGQKYDYVYYQLYHSMLLPSGLLSLRVTLWDLLLMRPLLSRVFASVLCGPN